MEKFGWKFIDDFGTFRCDNPQEISRLYFPLANNAEFMSAITPDLKGDIKTGQNSFLLPPATAEDLHNRRTARHFWIATTAGRIWSLAGANGFSKNDAVSLEAGLLWHKVTRMNKRIGLKAEILNFVPTAGEQVEIMQVTITNISAKTLTFTATSAIPIYSRSADNIRDHHHVSSLLNRIALDPYGVVNTPTMTFDERGHRLNHIAYYVLGFCNNGAAPKGFFPTVESFIGEGGNLDYPKAIIDSYPPQKKLLATDQGKECLGGLQFAQQTLAPGARATFTLLLGVNEDPQDIKRTFGTFNSQKKVAAALAYTKDYWRKKIDALDFKTGDADFDNWTRWVRTQPALRKIYGCSFLPDFDYGRGGKGWRDLWQDCLALLLSEPASMRELLVANFGGVRVDGSNATIITKKPGYFIADRNKIARVWMDHGIWPYFTLELYIHQTGDFNILLEKTSYFRDQHIKRSTGTDYQWNEACKHLATAAGRVYHGTIIEHILVQHLVQFYNVGKHNNIRLEGADWNDGMDMARHNGESVAFSAFYGRNLKKLSLLLEEFSKQKKITEITVFKELLLLLNNQNYSGYQAKQRVLHNYLAATQKHISGKTTNVPLATLIKDLNAKADSIFQHIRTREWLAEGFFNGYYDDHSRCVEGKNARGMRMTLTGQVYPILSGLATNEQIKTTFHAVKKYLKDASLGGFRLNTDFKEPQLNLGRAFGFAFGEKENGSFFSHMNVMFAYALYERGFAKQGFEVLNSIFKMASNTTKSKIYPGLPEYFNASGRGMYMYLTGSASWYVLTLLTQVFGIKGEYGDLTIEPKFVAEQFKKSSTLTISLPFAGKQFVISFINPKKLDYLGYSIKKVTIEGDAIEFLKAGVQKISLPRRSFAGIKKSLIHITILLS